MLLPWSIFLLLWMALTMSCNPSKVLYITLFFRCFLYFNSILSFAFIFCFSYHLTSLSFKSFGIIQGGASTLPLFLLLNSTSLRIDLAVNLKFLNFATLLALRSNSATFLSAFKLLDGSNFRSSIFNVAISVACNELSWEKPYSGPQCIEMPSAAFSHIKFVICCPNSEVGLVTFSWRSLPTKGV